MQTSVSSSSWSAGKAAARFPAIHSETEPPGGCRPFCARMAVLPEGEEGEIGSRKARATPWRLGAPEVASGKPAQIGTMGRKNLQCAGRNYTLEAPPCQAAPYVFARRRAHHRQRSARTFLCFHSGLPNPGPPAAHALLESLSRVNAWRERSSRRLVSSKGQKGRIRRCIGIHSIR